MFFLRLESMISVHLYCSAPLSPPISIVCYRNSYSLLANISRGGTEWLPVTAKIFQGFRLKENRPCVKPKGPFTQAIFVAATQCNFCRAEVATSKSHV